MSHNPERDGANAYANETVSWQSLHNSNREILATNRARLEIQRTRNISANYEAELDKTRKDCDEEIEFLKKGFEVEIFKKDVELSKKDTEIGKVSTEVLLKEKEILKKESEIARREYELSLKDVDIAKLDLEATQNKMSSYNYEIDKIALLVAIDEKFGEEVASELMDDMNEIAKDIRVEDAEQGFPRLENHKLKVLGS